MCISDGAMPELVARKHAVAWTVTDSRLKHFYSHSISLLSALEVCCENTFNNMTYDTITTLLN